MFGICCLFGFCFSVVSFVELMVALIIGFSTKWKNKDTIRRYGEFLLVGLLAFVLGFVVFIGIDTQAYKETKISSSRELVPLKKCTEIEGEILDKETYIVVSVYSDDAYIYYSLKDGECNKEKIESGKVTISEINAADDARIDKYVTYKKYKNLSTLFVQILTLTGGEKFFEYKIYVPTGGAQQISNIKIK